MNADKLFTAIAEAERFIEKANEAVVRLQEDKYASFGTKETGAARRASLDLTRSLADLRRRDA